MNSRSQFYGLRVFQHASGIGDCENISYIVLMMRMIRSSIIFSGPSREDDGSISGVLTETKSKTQKPAMYKVLMLNDDYTPMEFVVHTLQRFFRMSVDEATRVMLHVHQRGVGICGVFTFEVAETKVTQVIDFARKHQHPLQCTLEKD